jgi:hypothetical protein
MQDDHQVRAQRNPSHALCVQRESPAQSRRALSVSAWLRALIDPPSCAAARSRALPPSCPSTRDRARRPAAVLVHGLSGGAGHKCHGTGQGTGLKPHGHRQDKAIQQDHRGAGWLRGDCRCFRLRREDANRHRIANSATGFAVVLLDDVRPYSSARSDIVSFTHGPGPNRLVLLALGHCTPAGAADGTRRCRPSATGHPAAVLDVLGECVTKLVCVLRGKINLVRISVETKLHRLLGLTTVEVVDQLSDSLLGHAVSLSVRSTVLDCFNIAHDRSKSSTWVPETRY